VARKQSSREAIEDEKSTLKVLKALKGKFPEHEAVIEEWMREC